MTQDRPKIPADLYRRVLTEAGHRCAIPACRAHPVEVDHIEDWAQVKEHRFENLIALCPTCHARKGDKPGQITRLALRGYKAKLAVINSMYSDVERRILEVFAKRREAGEPAGVVESHHLMHFMVTHLIDDGYLEIAKPAVGYVFGTYSPIEYQLTSEGEEFVDQWIGAQHLNPNMETD